MRYFVNDLTKTDHRALLSAEKMATITNVVATVPEYIVASGAGEVTVQGDCIIAIAGGGVFKTAASVLNANNLDVGTFQVGKDYYIYLCDTGGTEDEKYMISLNSTFPAGYNAINSRKIGGFHYGKNRRTNSRMQPVNTAGETYGAGWESTVFDGIVPRSVWTLAHRPKCSPEGMVYLGGGLWVDIYISSDNGAGGLQSAYDATPMTGTEGMSCYTFNEKALAVGKRLLTYPEWLQAAVGSPEGLPDSNTNAWSATTNTFRTTTGKAAFAVSSIGCRDCVGNVWEWTASTATRAEHAIKADNGHGAAVAGNYGKWGWNTTSPFPGYGNINQFYDYSLVNLVAGGCWGDGVCAGARAVKCGYYTWDINVHFGARLGCDAL